MMIFLLAFKRHGIIDGMQYGFLVLVFGSGSGSIEALFVSCNFVYNLFYHVDTFVVDCIYKISYSSSLGFALFLVPRSFLDSRQC